jgi:hypothetical protein
VQPIHRRLPEFGAIRNPLSSGSVFTRDAGGFDQNEIIASGRSGTQLNCENLGKNLVRRGIRLIEFFGVASICYHQRHVVAAGSTPG